MEKWEPKLLSQYKTEMKQLTTATSCVCVEGLNIWIQARFCSHQCSSFNSFFLFWRPKKKRERGGGSVTRLNSSLGSGHASVVNCGQSCLNVYVFSRNWRSSTWLGFLSYPLKTLHLQSIDAFWMSAKVFFSLSLFRSLSTKDQYKAWTPRVYVTNNKLSKHCRPSILLMVLHPFIG